jgi:hypothetical protein
MPSRGYSTIGLKPAVLSRLQKITDEYYPGMFLPSTLIIMMNEIKRGCYKVGIHNVKLDFSGHYTSLTIRSDVKIWLEDNYKKWGEEYGRKYSIKSFAQFVCVFLHNMFESKSATQNYVIRLKESNFHWLADEYEKRKQQYKENYGIYSFEQFADIFLKEILERINAAKKILTL